MNTAACGRPLHNPKIQQLLALGFKERAKRYFEATGHRSVTLPELKNWEKTHVK